MTKHVEIYCDGACSGNPGPGGWGAILIYKGHEKEISGFFSESTNNRMELYAAISALRCLKESCIVTIYTDSAYVSNAFLKGWIYGWQRNGWRNSKKKEVENLDLWMTLTNLCKDHAQINWVKVKGHADNAYNNRCDQLATAQIAAHKKKK